MKVRTPDERSAGGPGGGARVPRDRPLGLLHSGARYAYGFGPDCYGIWDQHSSGAPTERFPPTKEGRREGWQRYLEFEPSAREAQVDSAEDVEEVETPNRWARWAWVGAGALVIVVIAVVFLTRGGEVGDDGSPGGVAIEGDSAHLEVSGDFSLEEDLPVETFEARNLESLFPQLMVSWAGPTLQLELDFRNPSTGELRTSEQANRSVRLSVADPENPDTPAQFLSEHGECAIVIDQLGSNGVSGTISCSRMPQRGANQAIDVEGTFAAKG